MPTIVIYDPSKLKNAATSSPDDSLIAIPVADDNCNCEDIERIIVDYFPFDSVEVDCAVIVDPAKAICIAGEMTMHANKDKSNQYHLDIVKHITVYNDNISPHTIGEIIHPDIKTMLAATAANDYRQLIDQAAELIEKDHVLAQELIFMMLDCERFNASNISAMATDHQSHGWLLELYIDPHYLTPKNIVSVSRAEFLAATICAIHAYPHLDGAADMITGQWRLCRNEAANFNHEYENLITNIVICAWKRANKD